MLTQKKLKQILYYNKDTGFFVYIKDIFNLDTKFVVRAGDIAGSIDNQGYVSITIKGKRYSLHRLAWLYTYGHFPKQQIDHINRIRNDNRIINLRDVSGKVNMSNKSKPGENRLEENIIEYKSKKIIDRILNKFDRERQEREDKISKDNVRIYNEQLAYYKYW